MQFRNFVTIELWSRVMFIKERMNERQELQIEKPIVYIFAFYSKQ